MKIACPVDRARLAAFWCSLPALLAVLAAACEPQRPSGLSVRDGGAAGGHSEAGSDGPVEREPERSINAAEPDAGATTTAPAPDEPRDSQRMTDAGAPLDGGGSGEAGAAGQPASSHDAGSSGQAGAAGGAVGMPAAGAGGPVSIVGPLTSEPNDDAVYVFDQTQLRTYNIQVAAADLALLDQNPSAETQVPAMLELDGVVYGPIGVRYKGGYSGFQPPCSAGAGAPKSGKCSLKLAFDEYDDKARVFGLKKLNLHSMNADASMLHDRLGYALFREFGVAAPRAVHAIVYVNGVAQGLFIAVEQIDGRFTRARFAEGGEGNLYKEIWPLYSDPAVYSHALETNETAAQVQGMLAFSESVKRGASDLDDFIDQDYTLRYLTVDRVIINDDGAMHFWCSEVASGNSPTDIGNHNYYWYQEQTALAQPANKFWLLPWDLDMTFAFNSDAHIITPWYQASACNCMQTGNGYQIAASCDPLVQHFISRKSDYDRLVGAFLDGPFSASAVDAKLAAWTTQVAEAVATFADTPSAHGVAAWQAGVEQLRRDIDEAREHHGYAY